MQLNVQTLIFLIFNIISFSAFCDSKDLETVLDKYASFKVVRMDTSKEVYSDLLGKTKSYEGEIFLSKGKFRWDIKTPEKSYLIFDGKTLWSVQYPADPALGKIQVTKSAYKNIKSHVLISALFDKEILNSKFSIKSSEDKNLEKFELVPKTKIELNTKKIEFLVDTKKNEINSLSYVDEIGNKTSIKFLKVEFTNKIGRKLYEYKAPPNAQVTQL